MTAPPPVIVTDHALVRWLERKHGIDMEGYRRILAAEVAPFVGTSSVIIDGLSYAFDGNVLVTVKPKNNGTRAPKHAGRTGRAIYDRRAG